MKDKSKTIDGINYSTKKSELIKEYIHNTNTPASSYIKKLYKTKNNLYFYRLVDFIGDRIIPCTEAQALLFINTFKSLF